MSDILHHVTKGQILYGEMYMCICLPKCLYTYMISFGKHTKNELENHHFEWESTLQIVSFNSYVKLPEGSRF